MADDESQRLSLTVRLPDGLAVQVLKTEYLQTCDKY